MTSLKYLLIGFVLTLSACGGGGSSSGGSGGELGRCEFTVDGNNVPQVTISISTGDQSIEQEIRSRCGLALNDTRKEVRNCLTSLTTPDMYPTAIRIKDDYVLERRTSTGSGGTGTIRKFDVTAEELPAEVVASVVFSWMHANGFLNSSSCGSFSKSAA